MLSNAEQNALRQVAALLSDTSDPWWILGSAAMALIGVDPGEIRDIDVLVSTRDARALMRRDGIENAADGGRESYRSAVFMRTQADTLTVEIMAGYDIRRGDIWEPVAPASREKVMVGDAALFIPSREEQISLLKRLGRDKDRRRLQLFKPSRD